MPSEIRLGVIAAIRRERLLIGRINAVKLKSALGQIVADRGDPHIGWLSFCS
jgi:hypothetical protein